MLGCKLPEPFTSTAPQIYFTYGRALLLSATKMLTTPLGRAYRPFAQSVVCLLHLKNLAHQASPDRLIEQQNAKVAVRESDRF
jgi:hypothetical protein